MSMPMPPDPMPPMPMMMMMPMYFSFSYENTFLFEKFSTTNGWQYFIALACLLCVCVAVELLSYIRTNMQN